MRPKKTVCRKCGGRGPRVYVDCEARETCLRHRLDKQLSIIGKEWIAALEAEETYCSLYVKSEEEVVA